MSIIVDALVQAVSSGTPPVTIGFCRVNVAACESWQALVDDVATKCCLPHALLTKSRSTLKGRPVKSLARFGNGDVLYFSCQTPGADEAEDAGTRLAAEEESWLKQVDGFDRARRLELAEKEASDAEYVANLVRAEEEEARKPKTFECPICRDDINIDGCVTLSCDHRYCEDCFAGYVGSKIGEKAVDEKGMRCALPGCTAPITSHEIKGHVTKELYDKYLNFAVEVAVESDPNHVRCPRCNLITIFPPKDEGEDFWRKAVCPNHNCKHKFCAICKDDQHDRTCEDYAKWKVDNGKADESFAKLMQSQQWSKCPHCMMPVELESGCFFMTCKPPCGKNFCYICGCKLTQADHYSHFPAGPYKRPCKNSGGGKK